MGDSQVGGIGHPVARGRDDRIVAPLAEQLKEVTARQARANLGLVVRSSGLPDDDTGTRARLLFFFVMMALLGEAFQFVWSQLYGRHVIAPSINATRTWEGLVGGSASTALAGMVLKWATPYPDIWHAAFMAMVVAVMGFAGAMTMSAIKRDRGVRDYGTLVEGHGGVLDRIDAICFAAPVFYHISRQLLNVA